MDAESYEDPKTAEFINQNFIPVKAHIKEHPAWFHRFDALWTPSVVVLDSSGRERARIEGYLPNNEFTAALENALGRIALFTKDYPAAERWFDDVLARYSGTEAAPEAVYWRGVAQYRRTNDHSVLPRVTDELNRSYPDSVWAKKAIPWGPKPQQEVAD